MIFVQLLSKILKNYLIFSSLQRQDNAKIMHICEYLIRKIIFLFFINNKTLILSSFPKCDDWCHLCESLLVDNRELIKTLSEFRL